MHVIQIHSKRDLDESRDKKINATAYNLFIY
jgi:hypothetical protein